MDCGGEEVKLLSVSGTAMIFGVMLHFHTFHNSTLKDWKTHLTFNFPGCRTVCSGKGGCYRVMQRTKNFYSEDYCHYYSLHLATRGKGREKCCEVISEAWPPELVWVIFQPPPLEVIDECVIVTLLQLCESDHIIFGLSDPDTTLLSCMVLLHFRTK